MLDERLYEAITKRKSIRRYQSAPLSDDWLSRVAEQVGRLPRLPHNNPPGVDLSTQPVEALVDAAGRKIRTALARLVHASDPIDLCSPARALVSSWLNPLSLNYKLLDFSYSRRAYADESCNRCLRCVRSCPTGSICLTEASIRFAESCCSCLRCYYGCPRAAIQTSERTEGKPRYRGPLGDYELPVTREAHRNDDRGPKDASQSDQQRCSAGI